MKNELQPNDQNQIPPYVELGEEKTAAYIQKLKDGSTSPSEVNRIHGETYGVVPDSTLDANDVVLAPFGDLTSKEQLLIIKGVRKAHPSVPDRFRARQNRWA